MFTRMSALCLRVWLQRHRHTIWSLQASAAGNSVPWMQAHCGHVLVPAHHEVFVVDDLHLDARCRVCRLVYGRAEVAASGRLTLSLHDVSLRGSLLSDLIKLFTEAITVRECGSVMLSCARMDDDNGCIV